MDHDTIEATVSPAAAVVTPVDAVTNSKFGFSCNGTGEVAETYIFFKKIAPNDETLPVSLITVFIGCYSAPILSHFQKKKGEDWLKSLLVKPPTPDFFAKCSIKSPIDIDCIYTADIVIDFSLNGKKERQIYSIGDYFSAKAGDLSSSERVDVMEGMMEKYRGWDMEFQIVGKVHFINPPIMESPAPARLVHLLCNDDRVVPVDASLLANYSSYFKSLFSSPSTEGFYTMEETVTSEDIEMLQRVMASKEVSPDEAGSIAELGCALEITPELKRMDEMKICESLIEDISCYPLTVFQLLPIARHVTVAISKKEDIEKHIKEIKQKGFLKKAGIETAYLFPLLQRVAELEVLAQKNLDEELDEE